MLVGMWVEGIFFCGVLYVGLMLMLQGLKVVEFNVCFGDLEVEVVLLLLELDFVQYVFDVVWGQFDLVQVCFCDGVSVVVIFVVFGYFVELCKGIVLDIFVDLFEVKVFYVGIIEWDG